MPPSDFLFLLSVSHIEKNNAADNKDDKRNDNKGFHQ